MRLIKQFVAVAVIAALGSQATTAVQGNPWLTMAAGLATAALAILAYAWVVRRTERRAVTEVASSKAIGGLTRGGLIGVGMFTAVIATIASLGHYHVNGLGSVTGALAILGFMAAAAATEELLFRGVLFRIVEERIGTWGALLLTGALFGSMHLINPDASLWGALCIAIEAGFMLAACYALTRTLWVPIGLHFGWNVAAGGIFSVVVSGNGASKGLLDATMSGPALVTGGTFGPEGSLLSVGAGTALTLGFLWLAHRRGRIVPRRRSTGAPATATVAR